MLHDRSGARYDRVRFFICVFLEETKDHIEKKEEFGDLVNDNFYRGVGALISGVKCVAVHTVSANYSNDDVKVLLPFLIDFDHQFVEEATPVVMVMTILLEHAIDLLLNLFRYVSCVEFILGQIFAQIVSEHNRLSGLSLLLILRQLFEFAFRYDLCDL